MKVKFEVKFRAGWHFNRIGSAVTVNIKSPKKGHAFWLQWHHPAVEMQLGNRKHSPKVKLVEYKKANVNTDQSSVSKSSWVPSKLNFDLTLKMIILYLLVSLPIVLGARSAAISTRNEKREILETFEAERNMSFCSKPKPQLVYIGNEVIFSKYSAPPPFFHKAPC